MSLHSPTESRRLLSEPSATTTTYTSLNSPGPRPSPENPSPLNNVTHADFLWIVIALWSAVLLSAHDDTIVATLASPIGNYFNRLEQSSYLGTSYLLSACCFTPLYGSDLFSGRLSDILGRKGAMLLALSLFGLGTLACGLAPSMDALILARRVAGMGGGGIMTVTSVAISDLVPLKNRGLYQGITSTLFGLGAGLGGPVGGWISDNWGWRAAFLLQMPLILTSFILVALKVNITLPHAVAKDGAYSKLKRIDFLGSFTLVVFVASMLSAFSIRATEELPWSHPLIWGLFVVSFIFGLAFVYVEARLASYPVMPLRLISQRTPLAIALGGFAVSIVSRSMIYNVPLYFSAVRLTTAADAGFHLLPYSVAIPIGSILTGWWMRRTGKFYNLILWSALLCILSNVLVTLWNDQTPSLNLWLDTAPLGFGLASFVNVAIIAMIASVSREDMAVATGIAYLFRNTGQVLGVSLSGTLVQSVLTSELRKRIKGPGSSELIEEIRHSISSIPKLAPSIREAVVASYATALRAVFISQLAISVLLFVSCIPIEERPLPGTHEEQDEYYRQQQSRNGRSE